ncbi:ataxin-1-like [Sebastes umbrosus]|uniref:ataxin-1-like n=1 Tax=Sebastes umbrosus TaxID=72105 RepID=UPI00189ECD62|nr:ataxin-1-like [Sebastes umbrosus]XP_037641086.1 ataxin-1-like [Sebastes umbrosus]XP_037641087.1 ataxin-1-like [Sebastes umbrosus]XP_037641088.1 ataxin-1-like [Sebastes umbrosus]XP_037641089.1 ataxin-1-like [Sebastes umbrosus]XP_037641090.1 ataxin-1-like [Sebastes umbrosus]
MKSNQERSNGCLPPKKREMLSLEHRPVVVAAAAPPAAVVADSPHTENLAWLASVASERCKSRDAESPRCPISSASSYSPSTSIPSSATPLSAVPLASLPAVYPTALPQQAGTIQFAQLGPNVQFISSGPYAGYISSHIIANAGSAPNSAAMGQRPQLDGYTTALISPNNKGEQQFQIGLSPTELTPVSLPNSPQVTSQYFHLDSRTPLTVSGNAVSSQTAHLQLHPHTAVLPQTLTLAPSQLLVQYADGSFGRKPEGHAKGVLNGELELVKQTKTHSHQVNHQQVHSYEARHILLPADYGQNPAGLQTSLVLLAQPNHHGAERDTGSNKFSFVQTEKGGICLGKPVSRSSSFTSLSSSDVVKSVAPHTVIQTTLPHEELPASLYSSTQPPIIGYITSANQHGVSYHAALPQHLVIPSGQSLLIPVSGTNNGTEIEVSRTVSTLTATTPQISTAMPHAYLATALSKCEAIGPDGNQPPPAVAHAPAMPVLPSNPVPAAVAAPSPTPAPVPSPAPVSIQASHSISSPSSPVALPPFFMRGSIIQLADGELKRVEDLKTEDFIQSAEISSELKIDSSTVERIDSGQSPNAVVIQFSVGELKAQVCVEVLLEYPFFVFGQGWSSCCPDRTTQLFELSCAKLCVGDVCVSLTLRGLRTTSVTDSHAPGTKLKTGHLSDSCHNVDAIVRNSTSPNAAGRNSGLLMKASGADRLEREQVTGPGPGEGIYGAGPMLTGEVRQESVKTDMPALTKIQCGDPERPTVRKRRWSAPERDQTGRAEEEPPLTLPKPSFIPQEVKISIEGHSSTGSERRLNRRIDC